MIPFNLYYERFNIMNLFPKLKKRLFDKTVRDRQEVRAHARENIIKLKDILKKDGYTIQKSEDSYTIRKTREMKLNSPRGESNFRTSVSIPYLKVWFSLAHEVGHVLQFQDGKPEIARRIDEYSSLVKDFNARKLTVQSIRQLEPELWAELAELYNFWTELDAWVRGLQFVPVQYQPMYKKYARAMYNTYKSPIVKQQMFRYTNLLSQLQ